MGQGVELKRMRGRIYIPLNRGRKSLQLHIDRGKMQRNHFQSSGLTLGDLADGPRPDMASLSEVQIPTF